MSTTWEDFEDGSKVQGRGLGKQFKPEEPSGEVKSSQDKDDCDWGMNRNEEQEGPNEDNDDAGQTAQTSRFISVYENYLVDKEAFSKVQSKNFNQYKNNPQKALREWFENEGNELTINTEQQKNNEIVCSLDIPIDDHDFTISSEVHKKKQPAIEEICLVACKLLDESQLLYPSSSTFADKEADQAALAAEKKRQFRDANKEDDIELDYSSKRHCDTTNFNSSNQTNVDAGKVNTYESLMADWRQLNMSILMLKAKLVKLDLSISKPASQKEARSNVKEEEEEVDPLDEFMSSLDNKTQLSMDEKIEKTRIKSEIASLETRQAEVAKLIELAKPKFDFNKTKAK